MQRTDQNGNFKLRACADIGCDILVESYGFKKVSDDPLLYRHPAYVEWGTNDLAETMMLCLDIFFANGRRVKLEN